ncbi:hypothetical protein [Pueribacillus theae]|uniref:hypothetical protein n=1 Tax=Pueribacillus theae TaxID=2171751 RepID=UPI0014030B0B|nr:hypothetical protein [Pueribacillus theae]
MKYNFVIGLLIIFLLINGWFFVYLQLPFSGEAILVALLSILFMALVRERFAFLYAVTLVLCYGIFLTVQAFLHIETSDVQLLYVYNHLLFTSFILSFWILLNYIKKIGYKVDGLIEQVHELQKYNQKTGILTRNEFMNQAEWVIKSIARGHGEAWFVEITITYKNKRIQKNLQELLEKVVLQSIREKFDLVTATKNTIYILLKDTHEEGVEIVLNRIHELSKKELNFVDTPYKIKMEMVKELSQLSKVREEAE